MVEGLATMFRVTGTALIDRCLYISDFINSVRATRAREMVPSLLMVGG